MSRIALRLLRIGAEIALHAEGDHEVPAQWDTPDYLWYVKLPAAGVGRSCDDYRVTLVSTGAVSPGWCGAAVALHINGHPVGHPGMSLAWFDREPTDMPTGVARFGDTIPWADPWDGGVWFLSARRCA